MENIGEPGATLTPVGDVDMLDCSRPASIGPLQVVIILDPSNKVDTGVDAQAEVAWFEMELAEAEAVNLLRDCKGFIHDLSNEDTRAGFRDVVIMEYVSIPTSWQLDLD